MPYQMLTSFEMDFAVRMSFILGFRYRGIAHKFFFILLQVENAGPEV